MKHPPMWGVTMIVISGSMRSGTSLWMQVLSAAGLPVIGEAFPESFDDALHEANPRGFYESSLVNGVYFATNPHPETGDFLHPSSTRRHAVKMFVPGLVRSDLAYLDRVIVTVRDRRAYARSLSSFPVEVGGPGTVRLSPSVQWWAETYRAICDLMVRGYPAHVVAYESLLASPERVLADALDWVEEGLDVGAAVRCVDATLNRSGANPAADDVDSATAEVMDELHDRICRERPLDEAFIERMHALERTLGPTYEAARFALVQQTVQRVIDCGAETECSATLHL